MKNKISAVVRAEPRFYLRIPLKCVEVLSDCAKKHYSYDCKQAALQGGFLYGWVNHLTNADYSDPEVTATWRELDILSKIIECPPPMTVENAKMLQQVKELIHCSITSANEIFRQVELEVGMLSVDERMAIHNSRPRATPLLPEVQNSRHAHHILDDYHIPKYGVKHISLPPNNEVELINALGTSLGLVETLLKQEPIKDVTIIAKLKSLFERIKK